MVEVADHYKLLSRERAFKAGVKAGGGKAGKGQPAKPCKRGSSFIKMAGQKQLMEKEKQNTRYCLLLLRTPTTFIRHHLSHYYFDNNY